MVEPQSFGTWLRRKRKALDLTREGLAERVGYSAETVRKIETEERRPSAQMAERLAEILQIPENERKDFLHFARGDWRFTPGEHVEESPWHLHTKSVRSNIPATTTSLIARERELAVLREYLSKDDIRLVTLIGPPGIGKTRLSIEVARASLFDFSDGVFFVALAPLDDATLLATTIAQALGYVSAKNISTLEQLKEGIGEKQMLIVLDNCEHLIEKIASLASSLLSACPRLKILATSRESLRISGEWLYPVPAFDVPAENVNLETASNFPALILFAERARAVRPDFALNAENIKTVSAICAHLDGLPLVIELIAARMRLMSPQALLERLNKQFILSADGMRAASARQKTVEDAIRWSYNLLSLEEQKLFVWLSVFAGGFTLEAAEAMFSDRVKEKSVSALVALLLDKSLLQRVPDHEPRFSMLVTIQEFARKRLQEMGEEAEMRDKHLAYFLDFADKGGKEMRGQNQMEWLYSLLSMRDNLRVAIDRAIETQQTKAALQMVRSLHWFWFVHSDHNEARRWFQRALAMPDAHMYPKLQAEALTQWAHHIWTQVGPEEAIPLVKQALAIARARDDKPNIARTLSIYGLVLAVQRNFTEAQSTLEESKALFRELQEEWEYAHTVMCLALCADRQNDLAASLSLHEQALVLFRKVGDIYFQSFALDYVGILRVNQGDMQNGIAALREALILAHRLDSRFGIAGAISRLAEAAQRTGDRTRAVRLYWAARLIWDSIGAWRKGDEINFENWLAPSRATLSEAEFAEAEARGRLMPIEQAIAYALEGDAS